MKDMYAMKLNDEISLDRYNDILRVPGGWIYKHSTEGQNGAWTTNCVFVPHNDEFKDGGADLMKPCDACDGVGDILQGDGSDSMGTLIPCEVCNGAGENIGTDEVTTDDLIEVIKVLRQTVMEVRAAQDRGPDWYTRGARGLYAQVRLHLDRASEAIRSVAPLLDK